MSARGDLTSSASLVAEPTETNIVPPSGEKAMSRVQCAPPLGRLAHDDFGRARRLQIAIA